LLQYYSEVQEQFYGEIAVGINDARDCITRKEFQLATLLLNLILRKNDDLSPRQKFRVLSNHGAAALGQGKPDVAAKVFLDAVSYQPDDELGKTNEALAYLLVGDLATCHAKAALLRQHYPASARLAALWVTTSPKEVPVSELESADISSVLRCDSEVSLAFARKALAEFDFDKARSYADAARKTAPEWAQPQLTLAEIVVGRALQLEFGFRPLREDQTALLRASEEACSRALELSRAAKDQNSEIGALIRRVDVRLLLKQRDAAVKDAEDALRLDPDDANVLLALAQVRLACGHVDQGISLLSRAHDLDALPHVALIYGKALFDRGREGDVDSALKVLREISVSDFRPETRPAVVTQVIQCFAKKKAWSEANLYLDNVSDLLDPLVAKILRGYLAHYQESKGEAERYSSEAHSLLTADANPGTKELLARLLMLVGRPADALPLWQYLFDLDAPGFDPGNLLDCASRLHRDDVVLQTCDRLHARGVNDWHLVEFEIPYLQKYNIEAAIQRLQAFVNNQPDHKLAKLRLSQIGLLLSKPELVRATAEDLPAINDVPLDDVIPAVQVMKFGGDPTAAVDYAYRFLRENFGEIQAHQALLMSMMPGLSSPSIPPTLEVVEPDSAVRYREIPTGDMKWVVLEDTDSPSGDFEEIPLNSPLAQELIGKRMGDTAVIARGRMQDRKATILQILPKYVRRYQDSMGEMQVRFGAASLVESVRVGGPEGVGGQSGLDSVLASVRQRADAVTEIRELYRSAPISLHLYGLRFGRNAYMSIADLAQEQGQQVKCNLGTREEWNQALRSLETAKALVVDITALATLRMLGLTKVLSSTKYRFIVSQRTKITLHEMFSMVRMFSAPGFTLSYEGGRQLMYEETAEEKERSNREDEEFIRFIEKVTEVRSGVALAALQPSKREVLERVFGQYGAESLALASDPDHVLWTDDLLQAQSSAQEFGVWDQCSWAKAVC
jgi:tetratricopeptide (TPR) repeat protein